MKRKLGLSVILVSIVGGTLLVVGNVGASTNYGTNVLPPAKAKILADEAQSRATAYRAPKTAALMAPTSTQLPPRVGGIFGQRSGPFSATSFDVRNEWQGSVTGKWLSVFAGGLRVGDGSVPLGGVRIYTSPIDPNSSMEGSHLGDWQSRLSGSLFIVSVSASKVTLQNDSGVQTVFDLVAKSFS